MPQSEPSSHGAEAAVFTLDLRDPARRRAPEDSLRDVLAVVDSIGRLEPSGSSSVVLRILADRFVPSACIDGPPHAAPSLAAALGRLEASRRPVVALIERSALGLPLEIALACQYRIAVRTANGRIGLPDARFGLVPAAGGLTRCVERFGIDVAVERLLDARAWGAEEACAIGWVDETLDGLDAALDRARAWSGNSPTVGAPGPSRPSTPTDDARRRVAQFVESNERIDARARGAIAAAALGAGTMDRGAAIEEQCLRAVELAASEPTRRATRVRLDLPAQVCGSASAGGFAGPVSILGTSRLAAALVWRCVTRDVECEWIADGPEAAAVEELDALVADTQAYMAPSAAGVADARQRIRTRLASRAELVIDAGPTPSAPPRPNVTMVRAMALPAPYDRGDSVRSGGTFTMGFAGVREPFGLAEIAMPPDSPADLSDALASWAAALDLVPIAVAGIAAGCSRIREAFMSEGMALIGDGVPAERVERAAIQAGMPAGPLTMLDTLSLRKVDDALHAAQAPGHRHAHAHEHDHGHAHGHGHEHEHEHEHGHAHVHAHVHVHEHVHDQGEDAVHPLPLPESAIYVLEKMAHGFRRLGRDDGGGFYDYAPDDAPDLWLGLDAFERGSKRVSDREAVDRLMWAQAFAASQCRLAAPCAPDDAVDLVAVLGAGFPAASGGVARWRADLGEQAFMARAGELAARFGDRFSISPPSH